MKKISLIFTYVFCLAFVALSPNTAFAGQNQPGDWMRVQSDDGDVSFLLPPTAEYFYHKEGFVYYPANSRAVEFKEMQLISAYHDKMLINVEAYRLSSPKLGYELFVEAHREPGKKTDFSRDGFRVKQFSGRGAAHSYVMQYVVSKTHLYILSAAAKNAAGGDLQRFVSSIVLRGKNSAPPAADATKVSALKQVDFEFVREDAPLGKTARPQNPAPVKNDDQNQSVAIIYKPFASYTEQARQQGTTGIIRLRLTFNPAGRISRIGVVKDLPNGLLATAVFAALRIKFFPAEKDAKPVAVKKIVEYSFSIY